MSCDRELRILKAKDALLWVQEAAETMKVKFAIRDEHEIMVESYKTANYIKELIKAELAEARKERP